MERWRGGRIEENRRDGGKWKRWREIEGKEGYGRDGGKWKG